MSHSVSTFSRSSSRPNNEMVLLALLIVSTPLATSTPIRTVTWQSAAVTVTLPRSIERGHLLIVDTTVAEPGACADLQVRYGEKTWPAFVLEPGTRRTLLAVSIESRLGRSAVEITCDENSRRVPFRVRRHRATRDMRIRKARRPGGYRRIVRHFRKPARHRVVREMRELGAALREAGGERRWTDGFVRPTLGVDTSPFGRHRRLKGRRSLHEGVDIEGDGDPIVASNRGKVLFVASDHYYLGNAVVLDHGEGLLSFYLHMDAVVVSVGQTVSRAEFLGTVGFSGRVTGPHLHFGLRYRGVYVDPHDFFQLLPQHPSRLAQRGVTWAPGTKTELPDSVSGAARHDAVEHGLLSAPRPSARL